MDKKKESTELVSPDEYPTKEDMRGYHFLPETVAEALILSRGIAKDAAKKLGCNSQLVRRYKKRFSVCAEASNIASNDLIDTAVNELVKLIERGHFLAIKYLLSTKGKNRGWTERLELAGPDGLPIPIEVDFNRALDKIYGEKDKLENGAIEVDAEYVGEDEPIEVESEPVESEPLEAGTARPTKSPTYSDEPWMPTQTLI